MGVEKEKSLRRIFTGFIVRVGIEMLAGGMLLAGLFIFLLYFGWIYPANFSETYAKNVMEEIKSLDTAGQVVGNIQDYVNYYFVNTDGKIIATNNSKTIGKTIDPTPKNGIIAGRTCWLNQEFSDGTLYLEYYVRSCYKSKFLNRYFLAPVYAMGFFAFIIVLLIVIINVGRLERLFKREMTTLGEAAAQISLDNLDVELSSSSITEVQRVVESFIKMKNELSNSLEREWQAQRNRRGQIAALAHDLKTPLTVILGNLDLLGETSVTEDQKQMIDVSIREVKHCEDYIGILVDMAKNTADVQLRRTPISLEDFFSVIESKARILGESKKVQIKSNYQWKDKSYSGDRDRIERAIMNLISNAIDYSPENGAIELDSVAEDNTLTVTVKDQGTGFSEELLRSGVELFRMGEESRSSKKHYGIGLYMAENTAKLHNGQLIIGNSKDGGAEIKIILK